MKHDLGLLALLTLKVKEIDPPHLLCHCKPFTSKKNKRQALQENDYPM